MTDIDDYWSDENQLKRQTKYNDLVDIENQIIELQKQYNKIIEENSYDLYERNKYIIYTFIATVPYNWETVGSTHIGTISDFFEETPGWISSTERCE